MVVAKKKPSALEALTRHDEERRALETKGTELRRAAALELGLIVLDAGGSRLGADALRQLVEDAVARPATRTATEPKTSAQAGRRASGEAENGGEGGDA
jgi:hypothetical protein